MKYKNILHIDDDPDDCEMFLAAVNTLGPTNYTAIHSPIDALKKLLGGKIHPDIIILDLNMPMCNGFEMLATLKREKALCDIPVIVFSTSAEKTARVKAIEAGASNYVVKPNSFSVLQQDVKRFLT